MKKAVTELTNDQKRIVNKLVDVADTDKLEAWLEEQHLWSAHAKLIRSLQSNDAKEDSLKLKIDIKEQAIIEAYDKYEKEKTYYTNSSDPHKSCPQSTYTHQTKHPVSSNSVSGTPVFDSFKQSFPKQPSTQVSFWGRYGKKLQLFAVIALIVFIFYLLLGVR